MEDSKHTPGPWSLHDHERNSAIGIVSSDGGWIGELKKDNHYFEVDEVKANARLIAASPALLKVLKWHMDALDLGGVLFYEKYGFNCSEVMPRTRELLNRRQTEK